MTPAKVPVTITFGKEGVQPPLYIAGTFSDPPWQLEEMEVSSAEDGKHIFKARFVASPGAQIHYKFKTAHGDWFLDDKSESVVDYKGFRNNSLNVPQVPTITQQPPSDTSKRSSDGVGHGASADWLNVDPFLRRSKGKSSSQDWDAPQDRIPLFEHECLVPDEQSLASGSGSGIYSHTSPRHTSQVGFDHEPDTFELADPALEKFPSRLDEISELIHKVEEDLEEDETEIEGVPPSAVLGLPRSRTNDIVGEFVSGSPAANPVPARPSRRLDTIPRSSAHSDVSASLLSIAEGVEEEGEERLTSPVVLPPSPGWRAKGHGLNPLSEDDEAVVMNDPNGRGSKRGSRKTFFPDGALPSPGMGESAASPCLDSTEVKILASAKAPTDGASSSHNAALSQRVQQHIAAAETA
ncbi:hypothetical protein MCOR25_002887 [Pyricularia grisea]|uniref:AMP-activated protein kinase glycogen-binding domain-containing protein n=1 Tax=Pyricularia grisea TaxID=148305 RepID=A0A6P8BJ74_PYRGI|nr:uncharacterized protein PgNI_01178 [Pyricularia grisea]KAI6376074.1 hypothetical protein MCOR25_002887 [Pyricularia grisea]TLD16740.1 hypothetical protein PgNI_01178 [Pyricularia grisea]